MNYDVDYFIDKFERIPERDWIAGIAFSENCSRGCAYWHCGTDWSVGNVTSEGHALDRLFARFTNSTVITVNDGQCGEYPQSTPKQRILAALRDIKAKQMAETPKVVEGTCKRWN